MSLISEGALSKPLPSLAEPSLAGVEDYLALLKPRVMSLVVFTALVGLLVAPGHVHPVIGFTALLCIAIGAGASGALNMWYDADIDAIMTRTLRRPIPAGRVQPGEALAFGATLAVGSVLVLGVLVNWFAAALLAFTIAFYVFVYTMWLKRSTPQNIVIGGLSGALPPAIGWASVTGDLSLAPLLLVAIIFMWTPPHFWALSLWRSEDYARAGVPMLPVVRGKPHTRFQILLYTLILVPLGVLPVVLHIGGVLYLAASAGLGLWFLWEAIATYRETNEAKEPAAHRLFGVSLVYMTALFAALIVEKLIGLPALSLAPWS